METGVPIQVINQSAAANILSLQKLYQRLGVEGDPITSKPAEG